MRNFSRACSSPVWPSQDERASKTQKTSNFGKGAARSSSVEPHREQATKTSSDPLVAHVIIEHDVMSSKVHRAVTALVSRLMPVGADFHIKARSKSASIMFASSGSCSIFVGRCTERDDAGKPAPLFIEIGEIGKDGIQYSIKVKHDGDCHVQNLLEQLLKLGQSSPKSDAI
jgi:hypothetical protein